MQKNNIKRFQPQRYALAEILASIKIYDAEQKYAERNTLVYTALSLAALQDMPCGIRLDPAEPEWPVVFIDLPIGQVSWHVPQSAKPWDGHTVEEKNKRIDQFAMLCGVPTPDHAQVH